MSDDLKNKQKLTHRPTTRREFLAQGLIAGLTYTFAPSILSLLDQRLNGEALAQAFDCGGLPALNLKVPVIIFDLSGGANFSGSNIIVGDRGGQNAFLPPVDYETLGLPAAMTPDKPGMTNSELGLMFHSDSGILRGIQSTASTVVRSRVDGAIFCTSSADDTGNNPHNPMYWLAKAGAGGDLGDLIGTRNTISGGNSAAPKGSINPTKQPITITSPNDAVSLVNAGRLSTLLTQDKVKRVMKATERLSGRQLERFNTLTLPEQVRQLVQCGYLSSQDIVGRYTPEQINPTTDALVTQAFNNIANDGNQSRTATIAKLVLDGNIGVGTIEKGGYDYHTNDRAVGEQRDLEAGELIGRVLTLANLKAKDVLIYVITDGGVSSNQVADNTAAGRGKFAWTGDSSQRSSSFMLLYRHAGRAPLRVAGRRQIGAYKTGGSVDNFAAITSNSVVNLNKTIVANFLALHGQEGELASIVGDNPFGGQLDQYLIFNKIR